MLLSLWVRDLDGTWRFLPRGLLRREAAWGAVRNGKFRGVTVCGERIGTTDAHRWTRIGKIDLCFGLSRLGDRICEKPCSFSAPPRASAGCAG